ncbi:tryparedoxin-like protein [Leishmania infantum JPCM5]|uniref:Tryparedoxin-like protein n=2 Tax=Leishmania infantum TaxID=5671 RepID=A4I6X2_LEIIN|nr:tryparedoxin-like protein [Leishmania infantum JPCM5]CAM70549.1 tryparedoxin-like protein [Leishmania infantum JPCM5]|eukprot:XP_001467491.1 tryparedoxin-like protein [Leishmania infantum JPCM5]
MRLSRTHVCCCSKSSMGRHAFPHGPSCLYVHPSPPPDCLSLSRQVVCRFVPPTCCRPCILDTNSAAFFLAEPLRPTRPLFWLSCRICSRMRQSSCCANKALLLPLKSSLAKSTCSSASPPTGARHAAASRQSKKAFHEKHHVKHNFEVLFVSSDSSPDEMRTHFSEAHGDWLALLYNAAQTIGRDWAQQHGLLFDSVAASFGKQRRATCHDELWSRHGTA